MQKAITAGLQRTVGIDLGDRYSCYEIVEADGETVGQGRLSTTVHGLEQTFGACAPTRMVIETGTHVHWVKDVLAGLGHEVIVANARKVEVIWRNQRKSDETDAGLLARLGRSDPQLLSPVVLRDPAAQNDLALIRSRENVVRTRTQLINAVRGLVKSRGARLPRCSAASFHKKALGELPATLRAVLEPMVVTAGYVTGQIRGYNRQIAALIETKYPVAKHLSQVSGVGPLSALTYVLVIGDPRRFRRARQVGAYVGLVARRDQSGARDPQLGITKTGHALLRRLLVQAAHYILGPFGADSDLRRFGLKIAARGGKAAKKRAVIAVARKLAVLLHRLWLTGEVYEPLRHAESARPR